MHGFHVLDLAVIAGYFAGLFFLSRRARSRPQDDAGFFLANRELGRAYQFFLNFGNSTDANTAVSVASLVYRQGVSGAWLGFQLVFLNPYFWFMNLRFRRARLVTMADLFEDRLGSRRLASFYALFHILATVFVVIGFGNLVTYKISSALIVKPEVAWTAGERTAVEGYRELHRLERTAATGPLAPAAQTRLAALRERQAHGELRSYVTALPAMPFYLVYTLVIGLYVIAGGMTATAMNEVLQGLLTIVFSVLLIPLGLSAIGGWSQLGERVPAAMFELVSTETGGPQVTGPVLFAIVLVAIVQINGIVENMALGGSAKDEFAARFGAVAGTYLKRLMTIMWAFCGLVALAMYRGPEALADPDATWGMMSRELLGPGLLGLMIAGLLANNMDTVAVQTLAASALFVRNLRRAGATADGLAIVHAGRWIAAVVLACGVFAALGMDSVFSTLQLVQTVSVPFGATVLLIFLWRRLTVPAVWIAILVCTALNVVGPHVLGRLTTLRTHPALVTRIADAAGRPQAVYFESVVRTRPDDAASTLEGRGRLHLELVALGAAGVPVERWSASGRFAARFLFDAILPFVLLIGCSLLTRPPERERVDRFYGRMKTPVGATPELDREAVAASERDPHRFDHAKLFPNSAWELTKWDRTDTVGFFGCCVTSGAIIALFWSLLRWASP